MCRQAARVRLQNVRAVQRVGRTRREGVRRAEDVRAGELLPAVLEREVRLMLKFSRLLGLPAL